MTLFELYTKIEGATFTNTNRELDLAAIHAIKKILDDEYYNVLQAGASKRKAVFNHQNVYLLNEIMAEHGC